MSEREPFGIRRKDVARAFGALEIGIGSTFLTMAIAHATNPELLIFLKIPITTLYAGGSILFISDGFVDLVKGTHHYLPLRIWQRLTPNETTKARLANDIQIFFEAGEDIMIDLSPLRRR